MASRNHRRPTRRDVLCLFHRKQGMYSRQEGKLIARRTGRLGVRLRCPPWQSVRSWPECFGSLSVVPTIERAGITTPKLVWHKRRRSFATLLLSTRRSLGVSMERVRHSTPDNAVGDHAQAIGDEKRNAGEKAASLDWKRVRWLRLLNGPLAVPFQPLTLLLDPDSRAK
jgi:hypothetical protein